MLVVGHPRARSCSLEIDAGLLWRSASTHRAMSAASAFGPDAADERLVARSRNPGTSHFPAHRRGQVSAGRFHSIVSQAILRAAAFGNADDEDRTGVGGRPCRS